MKIQKFENEKNRSNRSIRNSNMSFEKWREKLDLNLTIEALQKPCLLEALSKGSVGYERKKKEEATIPKATGWCPLLWHESKRNNNNNNNKNNNKVKAEYLRQTRKVHESKHSSGNLFKAMNT